MNSQTQGVRRPLASEGVRAHNSGGGPQRRGCRKKNFVTVKKNRRWRRPRWKTGLHFAGEERSVNDPLRTGARRFVHATARKNQKKKKKAPAGRGKVEGSTESRYK